MRKFNSFIKKKNIKLNLNFAFSKIISLGNLPQCIYVGDSAGRLTVAEDQRRHVLQERTDRRIGLRYFDVAYIGLR